MLNHIKDVKDFFCEDSRVVLALCLLFVFDYFADYEKNDDNARFYIVLQREKYVNIFALFEKQGEQLFF